MSTKLKIAAAVAAAVLLSACSSPKHEPMPLVNFTPSMEVTEVWSKGLSSAEGFLVPAVYDDMVFAAGGKTLTRLNARTGETVSCSNNCSILCSSLHSQWHRITPAPSPQAYLLCETPVSEPSWSLFPGVFPALL